MLFLATALKTTLALDLSSDILRNMTGQTIKQLILKSEFAALAGVSPGHVTRLCKGRLSEAIEDRKINLTHPAVASYLAERNTSAAAPTPKRPQGRRAKANLGDIDNDPLQRVPENIRAFADMSLRELAAMFGTDHGFIEWLNGLKRIEDIHEKRIKNAKAEGELVARDLIAEGVIGPIEQAHRKMLTDGAKNISRRVAAMAKAGSTESECEKYVHDQIGSFIRPVKTQMQRALDNA